jgi:hypothetical protein
MLTTNAKSEARLYEDNKEAFDKKIEIERDLNKAWTPPYPGFSTNVVDEKIGR